jgi:site-specific DNA-methyltransferase (adenine-specific)
MSNSSYNPDVLSCIANLSSDEVFTPPSLVNQILDMLPNEIWSDKKATFLDPACKSGVFLREIAKRLNKGLEKQIPGQQKRLNHIFKHQLFGLAITELTSLLSRRSVYCSKTANGKYSVCENFDNPQGNIRFDRVEHSWNKNRCTHCGVSKDAYDRGPELETHAYYFIHTDKPEDTFKMKFDVIIGNPPYQMAGGAGGSSDSSIYQLFVQQAIKLKPRYAVFITPSRWMAGGRGLDEFRTQMLNGGHLRNLTDFPDSGDAFPGVQIKGGVCYFLWDPAHCGDCNVTRISGVESHLQSNRKLNEFDVFVRDERAVGILRKILSKDEPSVVKLVSGDTPFGIATNFGDWTGNGGNGKIALHLINKGKRIIGFIKNGDIRKNVDALAVWKVLVPEAYGAGESFPHQILGKEIMAVPPSACTQSYLVVAPFQNKKAAESFASYYRTRLFRFLVSLRKITQHALRSTYTWVPEQTWDRTWTDDELYKKYKLTKDEIAFIESMVRPMAACAEVADEEVGDE